MFFQVQGGHGKLVIQKKKDEEMKEYLSAYWGWSKYKYTVVREGQKKLELLETVMESQ